MLNISTNKVSDKIDQNAYTSLRKVEAKNSDRIAIRMFKWSFFLLFIIALLPWTQNIRSKGAITTLKPNQRPQDIQTVIAGRIEEWKVQEGDYVEKGDTIVVIAEVKDAYFDEQLLDRMKNQLELQEKKATAYGDKLNAQDQQLLSLLEQRKLKMEQLEVKIRQTNLKMQNDSINLVAAQMDHEIATYQLSRTDSLFTMGLKSLTDLEKARMKAQQTNAKVISSKNEWLNAKNELLNLEIEQSNVRSKFANDYAKTTSEKLSTVSDKLGTESNLQKMENQYRNYEVRQGYYIITAPQDGFVTRLLVQGIGETIKEGQSILSFMPNDIDLAVEIYVDPIDLPLLTKGQQVRLQFDGWPAIIFSGWPGISYGTYGGEIYAIDRFIGMNGKYRVLVKPDESEYPWPEALRVGGGSKSMILLNNVPIWYELWRKINGFPPNFYTPAYDEK